MTKFQTQIAQGERFEFGKNWQYFLNKLSNNRIKDAEKSIYDLLGVDDLTGQSFLDIGSGSGLFSLAARRIGARVHSFDFDPQSVACTQELKRRYFENDDNWIIEKGSVLDADYLKSLGEFDYVYSWGVLHHTGDMWQALENINQNVKKNGTLVLALYNDQGRDSVRWSVVKRLYCKSIKPIKFAILSICLLRLWGPTTIRDFLKLRPFETWKNYSETRGMSPMVDVIDWVGGYPFEVSKPEDVFHFYNALDYNMVTFRTCAGGLGCNEFVFQKV